MNLILKRITIYVVLNPFFFSSIVICQVNNSEIIDACNLVQLKYNLEVAIVNGISFDNIYKNDEGIPFFSDDNYHVGYIIMNNVKHSNLQFKYNTFDQNLVVQHPDNQGNKIVFMPPRNFISEFSFSNLIFRKYQFPGMPERFYQVIYDGKLKCLYTWHKDRIESDHNRDYMAFKFIDEKRKSYLVFNDKPYTYKSKASFIKLFPEKNQKNISAFLKENKIKLGKSSDQKIAELIAYCESILIKSIATTLVNKE